MTSEHFSGNSDSVQALFLMGADCYYRYVDITLYLVTVQSVSTTASSFSGERSGGNPSWSDLSSAHFIVSVQLFYVPYDARNAARDVLFHVEPCPPTSF